VTVAAIILAAGRSTRFENGHKLLAEIDGLPVVRRVASAVAQSEVGDIVLVVGANGPEVVKAAGPGRWRAIENPNASDGLSSSLRLGLQCVDKTARGVLVALGDMPGITTELINSLLTVFAESDAGGLVFPVAADGRKGHPVIWPRALVPALEAVSGDAGGRALLDDYRELWRPVPSAGAGAFADIDTRADLEAFRKANPHTTRRK
jgi:molybdenum cofactor cytidylyltransferase